MTFGRGAAARPALIKSEKAREYEASAQVQIPVAARVMMRGPVKVTMKIYYASERPDLDESVVLDVLQAKKVKGGGEFERLGVYVNDRQVREKHVYHAIDKANPRCEIEIEELEQGLFEQLPPPPALPKRARRATVRHQVQREAPQPLANGDPF